MTEWGTYVVKPIKNQISDNEIINDASAVYELQFNYITILPDSWLETILQTIAQTLANFDNMELLYVNATSTQATVQFRPKQAALGTATLIAPIVVGVVVAAILFAIAAIPIGIALLIASYSAYKLVDTQAPQVSMSMLLIAAGVAAVGAALLSGELGGAGYVKKAKSAYAGAKKSYGRAKRAYHAAGG